MVWNRVNQHSLLTSLELVSVFALLLLCLTAIKYPVLIGVLLGFATPLLPALLRQLLDFDLEHNLVVFFDKMLNHFTEVLLTELLAHVLNTLDLLVDLI